jgi:hypothetical protein
MGTTVRSVEVGLDVFTEELDSLLSAPRADLPRSGNNRPIPPSSDYAASVLKMIGAGTACPNRMIAAVLLTNAADGVSLDRARLYVRRLDALLEVSHRRPVRTMTSLSSLARRETRAACQEKIGQLGVEGNENNPDALRAAIEGTRADIAASTEYLHGLELRLTAIQLGDVARPTLTVMR